MDSLIKNSYSEEEKARKREYYQKNRDSILNKAKEKYYASGKHKKRMDNTPECIENRNQIRLEKMRVYGKKWRSDPFNKEKMRQQSYDWYQKNKEHKLSTAKRWNDKNKDKVLLKILEWRENNKERYTSKMADWYQENKERVLECQRKYYQESKEKRRPVKRAYEKRFGGKHHRRAEKRGNYAEKVDRIAIFTRDKFKCSYCKRTLELKECVLEHKIPIAKGGSNTVENCTTSCHACNSSKHTKILDGIQITIFDTIKTG